ncbi:MAG: hypothetical protein CML23_21870 [Rhizobiaceae bacterium]|nr:hypothetical protein [Rhizobiaceae bacterium]
MKTPAPDIASTAACFLSDGSVAGPSTEGEREKHLAPVSFSIPMPPSTNHLFKNVKGVGRVKTKAYQDFCLMAVAAIRRQKVAKIGGYVTMVWAVERSSLQADISNRLKAAEDAIVMSGIIDDDRFVTAHTITWAPKANGMAHVQIYPIQRMTLDFYPSQDGASGAWIVRAPEQENEINGDFPQQSQDGQG